MRRHRAQQTPPLETGSAQVSSGGGQREQRLLSSEETLEETLPRSDDCSQGSDRREIVGKPHLMRKSSRLWGCCVVDGATCAISVALRAWDVVERDSGWGSHLPSFGSFVVSFSASVHKVSMLFLFYLG